MDYIVGGSRIGEDAMISLKIRKLDVITVYPSGENKGPKRYFGKKFAVVAYELTHEIKGFMDVPLPAGCQDIHPVAIGVIMNAIKRGVFDSFIRPEYVIEAA